MDEDEEMTLLSLADTNIVQFRRKSKEKDVVARALNEEELDNENVWGSPAVTRCRLSRGPAPGSLSQLVPRG